MPKKKLSFEDAMKRIEEIVSDLERGELPLEKSLVPVSRRLEPRRRESRNWSGPRKTVLHLNRWTNRARIRP